MLSSTITECTFFCNVSLPVSKILSRTETMAFYSQGAKPGQKLFNLKNLGKTRMSAQVSQLWADPVTSDQFLSPDKLRE